MQERITALANMMINRADADGLSQGHTLRTSAKQFEEAARGYTADQPTVTPKQFLGAWARARREWTAHTGEALV